MRLIPIILLAFAGAAAAAAQGMPILPPIQANLNDLKTYLNLTDGQVQSLEGIVTARNQASQAIYQQINQKQQQINALLQANSTDAQQIGQLEIDINNLRKQLPLPAEPYHTQALAILNPDQQAKLPALQTALQLQSAASQAVSSSLISAPPRNQPPIILPILQPAQQ